MALSTDLISQFAKITKDTTKTKRETTIYGTMVEYEGSKYVRFDGSDLLTPATMTVDADPGERVSVLLKDHMATVTGNISSPAARTETVSVVVDNVTNMSTVLADTVRTDQLEAQTARIDTLVADNVTINETLTAQNADIGNLQADNVTINKRLTANEAAIKDLKVESLDAETLYATFATISNLDATNAKVTNLDGEFGEFQTLTTDNFTAVNATIDDLEANKLSATDIEGKYANIDFSNIGKAAMEYFYANSGLIKDVTVGDTTITGKLVGVTIDGDLIEANTLVADKLVIQGEDGLYYKLNTNGMTVEAEQTDYNSLDGTVIKAQSITASKISVDDLVAFDATIGGFNITDNSIYSGVKESVNNTTRGVYLDKTGQMAIGDASKFIKYYKDTDGTYKLAISADSVTLTSGNQDVATALAEVSEATKANSDDLTAYMNATNSELTNLQTQIDGSITTWFYEYEPTNNNEPASTWTTDAKNIHLGDLFYDTITGYCYRWQVKNNVYSWNRITDVDVTKALADAHAAQDTADKKRRVFVSTPTPPYDIGDLWSQGSSGDLMRCKTAKTSSQSYAAADWVKASKYTDDTVATAAQNGVNALVTRMNAAETNISQNSEAIALRATKTELTTTLGNYYTREQSDANLTVKANEITSDIEGDISGLDTRVTSAESSITQLSNKITSNVTETTNLGKRMTTMEQNANGFNWSIEEDLLDEIDSIQFGGRNLLTDTTVPSTNKRAAPYNKYLSDGSNAEFATAEYVAVDNLPIAAFTHVYQFTCTKAKGYNSGRSLTFYSNDYAIPMINGREYTMSMYARTVSGEGAIRLQVGTTSWFNTGSIPITTEWERYSWTFTYTDESTGGVNGTKCYYGADCNRIGVVQTFGWKLEVGNRATDWTPSVEDVKYESDNAAKTATNYMSLSSADGLVIGDRTSSTLKGNIQLKAESSGASIALRDGSTILTKFSATSKTFSGVTSAKTTSSTSTESSTGETGSSSETITYVSQTISKNQNADIVSFESDAPIYFSQGIRTDGVTINDDSLISNVDVTLNGSLFDVNGRSVIDPVGYNGNLVIGSGRYKNATSSSTDWTVVMGNRIILKSKKDIYLQHNGMSCLNALNSNGNMTVGWHLYSKGSGNLNLYGGDNVQLVPSGTGNVVAHRPLLPSENAAFSLGRIGDLGWSNIYIGNVNNEYNGLRINVNGTAYNLVGRNADNRYVIGNNSAQMYYHVRNVDTTTTGDAFRFTSGNDGTAYNTSSVWLFGRSDTTSRCIGSYVAYNRTYSSAANMHITANGVFGRSTSSSERYKTDIELADINELRGLYDVPIKKFKFKQDYIAEDDELYNKYLYGFIVEDLEDVLPCAVQHKEDEFGEMLPEMWNSNIIVPSLLKLIQDLNDRVKTLEGG